MPSAVYFCKGQIENLASSIKQFGGNKVLLTYGGGSIKKNGIYAELEVRCRQKRL